MTIKLSSRENKQKRPRLLVFANFITCLPPEIPRFYPTILKLVPRQWVSRGGAQAWTKLRPEGLKKNFFKNAPPPLSEGLDPATGIF